METPLFPREKNPKAYNPKEYLHILLFILPLLVIYEIGIFLGALGEKVNGADAIFRLFWGLLSAVFGTWVSAVLFGLLIVIGIFYAINEIVQKKKRIRVQHLGFMALESVGIGFILAVLVYVGLSGSFPTLFSFEQNAGVAAQAAAGGLTTASSQIVAAIGAGVFEELLFRVFLLQMIFLFLTQSERVKHFEEDQPAFIKAAVISSIIFALMHLGSVPVFGLASIFVSSLVLSFIYAKRGYGVVVGVHIVFDLCLLFGIVS